MADVDALDPHAPLGRIESSLEALLFLLQPRHALVGLVAELAFGDAHAS
jgi:hypothetical protein